MINEELLEKYKKQNPAKYAQKFGNKQTQADVEEEVVKKVELEENPAGENRTEEEVTKQAEEDGSKVVEATPKPKTRAPKKPKNG